MTIRKCRTCKVDKPREQFPTDLLGRPKPRCLHCVQLTYYWCNSCKRCIPVSQFYVKKTGEYAGEPKGHCIPCRLEDQMVRKYGLDWPAFARLLDAQGYRCAACPQPLLLRGGPAKAVDHDHGCCPTEKTCGRCVRGILCAPCNKTLGFARDDVARLRSLASYVERRRRGTD